MNVYLFVSRWNCCELVITAFWLQYCKSLSGDELTNELINYLYLVPSMQKKQEKLLQVFQYTVLIYNGCLEYTLQWRFKKGGNILPEIEMQKYMNASEAFKWVNQLGNLIYFGLLVLFVCLLVCLFFT